MRRSVLTSLVLSFWTILPAQDVAQWRGPDRNGIYNETGLMNKWPDTGPKMIWSYDQLGEGYSAAAVTSSGVYTSGMINGTGYIFALDHNGRLRWKKEYGKEWTESHTGVRSTPLVINDRLYMISSFGSLSCMNTNDGKVIWTVDIIKEYGGRNIQWGVTENLLYDGDILYCSPGGRDANIIALDRKTGKLIWKSSGGDDKSAYCSPVIMKHAGKKILVSMMEKNVQGYDAITGEFLWKYGYINQYSVHPNPPVYVDGYLYCTAGYGKGGIMLKLSADGKSVTRVWENASHDPKIGGFVVLNGRIYGGGDKNRQLFCIDWKTGKEIFSLNQLAPSNIISNGGLLYIYSENGKVSLVEPLNDKFNIISSFNVSKGEGPHWAHLVINNKRLYVRHGSSLMVFDIAAGKK